MKRLIIALSILALLVGANLYSRSFLDKTGMAILEQVEKLEQLANSSEPQHLEAACAQLQDLWLNTERAWSRFLRSDRLESITIETARLPALARHGQAADVAAGLCEIRILLQEVLAFESPTFSDIL